MIDLADAVFAGVVHSAIAPGAAIPFSIAKLLFLIVWIYLCMYTVIRLEHSPMVPAKHKPIANIFALLIGPLLVSVLFIRDTARKIKRGEIDWRDIMCSVFGNAFKRIGSEKETKAIELMDSAGRSFNEVYGSQGKGKDSDSEILNLTEGIILDAITQRASDVLIDPKSNAVYTVRFRIDGFLQTISQIDGERCSAVVNSIKAISNMDIAEKRRPQDGSFMAKIPQGSVFFRVASAGVLGGEKLSIRVLNQSTHRLRLDEIGLSEKTYEVVTETVRQSSGMVIVCGPTGSGKTTSLYAMLDTIDFFTRNVVTIEDPIEYVLDNASQIEVNVKANITFANTLRSMLRQDPDVICVGEIRDSETAKMALQASQTGHLVLATLHSSSNMATLVRLIELGIRPLLLASALSVIISQRLVRRLCDHCKVPADLSEERIADFKKKGINYAQIMSALGCEWCNGTGYYGRTAIMDVMYLDDAVKARLADNKLSMGDLKNEGDNKGRSTLRKEGLKKVLEGLTTFQEVKRVTSNLG